MVSNTSEDYGMNIFIFDTDPVLCAEQYPDTYVNKLTLECCQMICTAHHHLGTPISQIPYRKAHSNHPVSKWVRKNSANYWWTVNLVDALIGEFGSRFGKGHACERVLHFANETDIDLPYEGDEPLFLGISCEDKSYKIIEVDANWKAITSYRRYFIERKRHLGKWTNRKKPFWFPSVTLNTANKEQIADAMDYWTKLSHSSDPFANAFPPEN